MYAPKSVYKGKPAVDAVSMKRFCEIMFGAEELPTDHKLDLGVAFKAGA